MWEIPFVILTNVFLQKYIQNTQKIYLQGHERRFKYKENKCS